MYGIVKRSSKLGGWTNYSMAKTGLHYSKDAASRECYAMRRGNPGAQFAVVYLGNPEAFKVLA